MTLANPTLMENWLELLLDDAPETAGTDPMSPYGLQKYIGEQYCRMFSLVYGLDTVNLRYFNIYGPRMNFEGAYKTVIGVFGQQKALGKPLTITNDGEQSRDFTHVDDIVDGLIACALKGKAGGVYNIASGVETSIRELAELINEVTANKSTIDNMPARSWDRSGKRHGDTSKSENELGFKAQVSLPIGLQKTVDWTKENIDTIKQCMKKHERYVREIKE